MTKLDTPQKTKAGGFIAFGCFWAFLTGSFFSLPSLPVVLGLGGILIALTYSWATCLLGKPMMWFTIGLTTVIIIAYASITDFSIINYAVWMTINVNFVIFGLLSVTLHKTLSIWRSWLITASTFSGSLGLGWLCGLVFS